MRFALVEGKRQEAQPGQSAECPACGQAMVAKCGEHRVWHWAHRGARICDPWWESETEWHRAWKDCFPKDWQEIVRWSEDGEKHVADVMTASGVVLEFQHSYLRRDERAARESFYAKMLWVVDGRRRVRDRARFFASLAEKPRIINFNPLTVSIPTNESVLPQDWMGCRVPVFFDFGDASEPGDALHFDAPVLWRLNPRSPQGRSHLSPVAKSAFRDAYLKGLPLKGLDYSAAIKLALAARAVRPFMPPPRSFQLAGFAQHLARKQKARSRVRL